MTLRTTPEHDDAIARLAARDGVSKNEAVLRAVQKADDDSERRARLTELSNEMRETWAETLDRLGTV